MCLPLPGSTCAFGKCPLTRVWCRLKPCWPWSDCHEPRQQSETCGNGHVRRAAGTLKDDQHCYLCGQNGHRQFECPNRTDDIYKLPTQMQEKVDNLYQRDVARMAGDAAPTGAMP